SPASKLSRKTMISAASTDASFLYNQGAGGLLMEVVHEAVPADLQRTQVESALAVGSHHFLHPERRALEFHRRGVEVLHLQHDRLTRRSSDLSGVEAMVLDGDVQGHGVVGAQRRRRPRRCAGKGKRNPKSRSNRASHVSSTGTSMMPLRYERIDLPQIPRGLQ